MTAAGTWASGEEKGEPRHPTSLVLHAGRNPGAWGCPGKRPRQPGSLVLRAGRRSPGVWVGREPCQAGQAPVICAALPAHAPGGCQEGAGPKHTQAPGQGEVSREPSPARLLSRLDPLLSRSHERSQASGLPAPTPLLSVLHPRL